MWNFKKLISQNQCGEEWLLGTGRVGEGRGSYQGDIVNNINSFIILILLY